MRRTKDRTHWTGKWTNDPWGGFPKEVEHLHRIVDWTLAIVSGVNPGGPLLTEGLVAVAFATYLLVAAPHGYKLSRDSWVIALFYFDNWRRKQRPPAK